MKHLALVATLALASVASAGELPDAPTPQSRQRLWDRTNIISQSLNFTITAADVGETCYALARGNREVNLPTQSCAGVALMLFGERVVGIGLQALLLHIDKGWSRRSARLIPFVPYTGAEGSVAGLTYSLRHLPNNGGTK